jgi:hypothetical protein
MTARALPPLGVVPSTAIQVQHRTAVPSTTPSSQASASAVPPLLVVRLAPVTMAVVAVVVAVAVCVLRR